MSGMSADQLNQTLNSLTAPGAAKSMSAPSSTPPPLQSAGGANSGGLRTGGGTPGGISIPISTDPDQTPIESAGGATPPSAGRVTSDPSAPPTTTPAAGAAYLPSQALGGGGTWNPTDWMQAQFAQANANNNSNGIAVPPNSFARWSTYPGAPTLNTSRAALQGFPGSPTQSLPTGGTTIPTGGGTQPPPAGGIAPGNGTAPPTSGGGLTPPVVTNPNPPPIVSGNGAPHTGSYNTNPNGYLSVSQNNQSGGATGNGTLTQNGFRFTNATSPEQVQFNNLMNAGNYAAAYQSLLSSPAGAAELQAAWGTDITNPNSNPQTYDQIVNNYAPGGSLYSPSATQGLGSYQFTLGKGYQWVPATTTPTSGSGTKAGK